MASIDWQTPLSTTFGLVAATVAYILTGLYWVLSWVVLNVVANAPRYVYRVASLLATPLTYPLYYIWRLVAFLLSPIWVLGKMSLGLGSWALGLAARFKVSLRLSFRDQDRKLWVASNFTDMSTVSVYLRMYMHMNIIFEGYSPDSVLSVHHSGVNWCLRRLYGTWN
jgi:hypothetical protein